MARGRGFRASSLAAALALTLGLAACSQPDPAPPPPSTNATVPATASTIRGIWITGEEVSSPDIPYLRVVSNGSWTGSDGCNGVQGTWSIDDDGLMTNTAGPHTLIYCDGEPLPSAFASAHAAMFSGDRLLLLDHNGETLVELVSTDRVPTTARGTEEVVGWWGANDLSAPRQVFLDISANGTLTGNDGCNTIAGTWRFSEEGSVELETIATTLKECPDYDPWLSRGASLLVDGDILVVTDSIGSELSFLERSRVPSTSTPTPPAAP